MSGLRVIYPDGTVVEVPIAMETADAAIRDKYIEGRYLECQGSVTFKQTMPGAAEGVGHERDEAHGGRRRSRQG